LIQLNNNGNLLLIPLYGIYFRNPSDPLTETARAKETIELGALPNDGQTWQFVVVEVVENQVEVFIGGRLKKLFTYVHLAPITELPRVLALTSTKIYRK
jgi:hypothetical protein